MDPHDRRPRAGCWSFSRCSRRGATGPETELAERLEVSGPDDPPRRRAAARARLPGRVADRPGRRLPAARGTAMPPLLLDDDEAIAIAVGLRTAARASVTGIEETAVRALVKLEQVLPAHLRRRVEALGSATIAPAAAGPTVDPQHLTVIAAACRDSECLRFDYRSRDGTDSRREVEPHALVNLGRRWYLVAWDRRREDWRSFRDRPAGAPGLERRALHAARGRRPGTRPPTSSRASAGRRAATRPGSRCTPPPTRSAGASPRTGARSTPIDEHRCELRTRRRRPRTGWRCGSRCSASTSTSHEPPELAEHLRALADRLRRAAA